MKQNDLVLMLYACCIPVKGARRSIICDLQRGQYFFIPNALFQILKENEGVNPRKIKMSCSFEENKIIEEYIDFILKHDLGFFTEEPSCFPKIELSWKSANIITNAIIDSNNSSTHSYEVIIEQLQNLGCSSVQFRFYDPVSLSILQNILNVSKVSRLRSIEFIVPFSNLYSEKELLELIASNKRLHTVVVHSSPFNIRKDIHQLNASIVYLEEKIQSSSHCGFVHPVHFRPNIQFFTEAMHHNSCLNRKISLDIEGRIKNCPSGTRHYGSFPEVTFAQVLEEPEFKAVWGITKDHVKVCRDCEFRYICTDCRVFTQDPEDVFSKPKKCSYDPYKATWEEECDNPQSVAFKRISVVNENWP